MSSTTLDKQYFARDADGSLKQKQPCQTPGCDYPNYHVCLFGKEDTTTPEQRQMFLGTKSGGTMSEFHKAAIAEAQRLRHAQRRAETYNRDMRIQDLFYVENWTRAELKKRFDIGDHALRAALERPVREFE